MSIKLKMVNLSNNPIPEYSTENSVGMDIRANIPNVKGYLLLEPLSRLLIPTGLFIELPEGYEAQIRPRSGLALKNGITVLNTPGTIDADYRGEIGVILINLSNEGFIVKHGDRIAQMVITKYEKAEPELVKKLLKTERGDGGFGHTGI